MKLSALFDRTFLKFIIVGVINTVAGSLIMFALYNAVHLNYWLSSVCNYCLTSVLSFFLNKYFTFGVRHWTVAMVIMFIITIVVSYGIAYGAAKPAMNYFLRNNPRHIRENAALLAGMCLFTGLNYLGQRLVVFREGK